MNIQDIRYIVAIAEAGSISKAADRLLVAQPSLSKCIQKVEREYEMTLFDRVRGSSIELTTEGELFLKMSREILTSHGDFEEQLKQFKRRQKNSIAFGIPTYHSISVVGPLVKAIHEENKDYVMEVQIKGSSELKRDLLAGVLDIIQIGALDDDERFWYETLYESPLIIYLRRGCPAAEKVVTMEGIPYPVLRMEDLEGEPFATNMPGNSTRAYQDRVVEQTGVQIEVIEASSYHSRISMVEIGRANMIGLLRRGGEGEKALEEQLYYLHPDQNIKARTVLACRPGFQRDPRFKSVLKCMREMYQSE